MFLKSEISQEEEEGEEGEEGEEEEEEEEGARSARGQKKNLAETRFFFVWEYMDSFVFLLELGRQTAENMAQGLENMAQKASHRHSQTAICSHRQPQAKKNHKIRLADGPWLSRCRP